MALISKPVLLGGQTAPTQLFSAREDDPYFAGISDGFERVFAAVCQRFVEPSTTAIDVGANIGCTSAILSQLVPDGAVHALEPGPHVFASLKRTVEHNRLQNVHPHNLAAGESEGSVRFNENSA